MVLGRRSARRRGMVMGAAIASSRAKKAAPAGQSQSAAATPAPTSEVEQLQQLATLRDQGILTDEEFTAKKKQLLGI